jgi:hypothetical protein
MFKVSFPTNVTSFLHLSMCPQIPRGLFVLDLVALSPPGQTKTNRGATKTSTRHSNHTGHFTTVEHVDEYVDSGSRWYSEQRSESPFLQDQLKIGATANIQQRGDISTQVRVGRVACQRVSVVWREDFEVDRRAIH